MSPRFQKINIAILIILFFVGLSHNYLSKPTNRFNKHCVSAQKSINLFEENFNRFANNSELIEQIIYDELTLSQIESYNNSTYYHYIYKGEELIYWNKNSTIPEININNIDEKGSLLEQKNGYYISFKKQFKEYSIIGMMLIKNQYSISNKYLKNDFNDPFLFNEEIEVETSDFETGKAIKNLNNETLFKLHFNDNYTSSPIFSNVIVNYLTIIVFWIIVLIIYFHLYKRYNFIYSFLFLTFKSALFLLGLYFLDLEIKKTIFFSPELYASQYFGQSLGHLFFNTFVFFAIGLSLAKGLYQKKWGFNKISFYFYLVALLYLFFVSNSVVKSLIIDSVISFEINNFTLTNIYTLLGLLIIILSSISMFVYFYIGIYTLNKLFKASSYFLVVIFFIVEIIILYYFDYKTIAIISPIISGLILLLFLFLIRNRKYFNKLNYGAGTFFLFSILISTYLSVYNVADKDLRKSAIANQLSETSDRVAEFKYNEIQNEIQNDHFFKKFFISPFISQRELQQRLNFLYFGGYMSKFNVNSTAFNLEGKAIKTSDTLTLQYYKDLINDFGEETTSEQLFLIPKSGGNNTYLSILPIKNNENLSGTLVLELVEKTYQRENLYPELLIEQKVSPIAQYKKEADYEYAIYNNDYLVAESGEYPFPYFYGSFNNNEEYPIISRSNGFRLNFFETNNNSKVVISSPEPSTLVHISTFSYVFCFISVLSVVFYFIISVLNIKTTYIPIKPIRLTFKNRINIAILTITISSFVIIGSVTVSYFTGLYKLNNTDKLIKKQKSVLSSIEYLIAKQNIDSLTNLPTGFSTEIASLAEIHSIDINLFDIKGDLVNSSQPSIFGNGLISKKMNPIAKYHLLKMNKERFIQNEAINKLKYQSVYVPIRTKAGKALAFLNLPYFAQEETLQKELSILMVALVNVYVLLLIISTIIAFIISNSITSPLANISKKLSLINLDVKNERIEWKGNDEIGALVAEYNKMIRQIEEGATTLAQSERESAWREMARQIAHEIKNPLTPMKLSIQHLQRALKEDPENAAPLAERVSKTMVEQIDNLSEIATAFSSFAKMPTANKENVDLIEIIKNVSNLFNQNKGTNISIESNFENAFIFSDYNQLLSVFNNLVKNAQQATEDTEDAWVKITVREKNGNYVISVKDNGEGMSDERKSKIFVPNFTTKSSGTGLGLAISKQIITNNNGVIWFKSIENVGTTFYVSLPKS